MPNDALAIEHEIQRLMLERLGIEWTPGEPFYSLVEAEIERLRAALEQARDDVAGEIVFQRGSKGPWIPATPDDPLIAIVERIDAVLGRDKEN